MRHLILLPDLGQTTSEAMVVKWLKQPGDAIAKGEPLVEVETDKAEMDVESFVDGYLRKTLAEEGEMVTALMPVAVVTDSADEEYSLPSTESPEEERAAGETRESVRPAASATRSKVAAAPAARKRAAELDVDLSGVPGSGPNGMVTRRDVEQFAASGPTDEFSAGPGNRAQTAMAALVEKSKREIPHFYLRRDVNVEPADSRRKKWNVEHPELKATWNEVFVLAASRALKDVPRLNTSFEDGRLQEHEECHVLVVAAEEGRLNLIRLAAPAERDWKDYLTDIKHRLANGKLSIAAAEHPGGPPRLAVSNLGMYGAREFSAIIPPGCTAVLAVGAVRWAPAVLDGRVEARQICSLTLSADHRIVDGITAARFLERVEHHLDSIDS